MEGCRECEKDREAALKVESESKGRIRLVAGIRWIGKAGPITQRMMEVDLQLWKLAYEKRHGHPYPEIDIWGANDQETSAWIRG